MSLRRGGFFVVVMDFTASNRGSSPGDVQNQEGEFFSKQWKHIFLICWQIMVWDNHWTDQKNWILTYSIYVISQFLGGFDSPICLQFHFSIRFLKIHVSSGLKPRGHPSISLVDQSVDLTYVKRDRLATGLLVLERFRKRLGLGIKVFELAFFWISKERQISLYRFFFAPISEWFPLVWNLWDFFVDFFFFSRDSLKATFWNSKLWPVRKGFTAELPCICFFVDTRLGEMKPLHW